MARQKGIMGDSGLVVKLHHSANTCGLLITKLDKLLQIVKCFPHFFFMCAKEPTILVGQVRKQNYSTQNLQCKRKKIISKAFMLKNIQA